MHVVPCSGLCTSDGELGFCRTSPNTTVEGIYGCESGYDMISVTEGCGERLQVGEMDT
jgi:hypothetical protein